MATNRESPAIYDCDLSGVPAKGVAMPFSEAPKGYYTDPVDLYINVIKNPEYFAWDVLTYTVGVLGRLDRLIYTIRPDLMPACSRSVCVRDNHAKLWIAKNKLNVPCAAFIGSMNFGSSLQVQIMWQVPKGHLRPWVRYYNELWRELTK